MLVGQSSRAHDFSLLSGKEISACSVLGTYTPHAVRNMAHHYPELDFQTGTEGFNQIRMRGNALQKVGGLEVPLLFQHWHRFHE